MAQFPHKIRVTLERNGKAGLFAAVSPELPGLMTVAKTIDEIEERLPAAIAQLIKAQYGADVSVEVVANGAGGDFKSLADPRIIELRAA
jgi:predicted RNase H-like HicB family nuclease